MWRTLPPCPEAARIVSAASTSLDSVRPQMVTAAKPEAATMEHDDGGVWAAALGDVDAHGHAAVGEVIAHDGHLGFGGAGRRHRLEGRSP